ncbi:MAG: TAXI family TRAP transporter solute-binding subunit [Candidatus Electrothrix sp. GW3-4]|uniref:TAXI family TRAP transporter solute-binding subunit n=1 Tax=Candidatus Electrothrix sp. GW3-4 TaxID=3126740 RepID=UPI0030D38550
MNSLRSYTFLAPVAFFVYVVSLVSPTFAATEMGIVTGGTKGTYIQIGYDISRLVKQEGIYLNVYPSNGSLDNIADVYERKDLQMGIVQSDVLASIHSSGDSELNKIAKQIKMIFPLYNEEVHILASRSIKSFADLEGKIVAIGSEGSGTALTASLLFEVAGVTPRETKYGDPKKALMLLRSEVIDAMIYISGYPVSLFSGIYTENLHLLSITNQRIAEHYVPSIIPAGTYNWQKEPINTFAVKAVLMSYNYDENHQNCKDVGEVARIIYKNEGWLKKNGHAKWEHVDLDAKLAGWEQYKCVSDAIQDLKKARQESPDDTTSVKNLLRKKISTTSN